MQGLAITAGQPQEPAGRRQERGQGQRPEPALRRVSLARPAAVRQHELVQRPQLLRRPEGPRRGHARGRLELLQDVLRAEQRGPRRRRRLRPGADEGLDREVLRRDPLRAAAGEGRHLRAAAGEGEARDQGRHARHAARARDRLPRAAAQHARVLRDGPPRPDPRPGQGQPALPGARPEERPDRRASTAASTRASATCTTSTGRRSGTSSLFHDKDKTADQILEVFDAEIDEGADDAGRPGHARPRAREDALRSSTTTWSSSAASARRTCSRRFALFDDDPSRINRIEEEFEKVTPALMQKTAQEYLRPGNRTILVIDPKARRRRRQERVVGGAP